MSTWIEVLNQMSQVWFDIVSGVVLQSIFVFGIALFAAKLLHKFSASLRFWIWQAAALKLLLIPLSFIVVIPFWAANPAQEVLTSTWDATSLTTPGLAEPIVSIAPLPSVYSPPKTNTSSLSALSYLFIAWLLICWAQIFRCFRRLKQLSAFLETCSPASEEHQLRLQLLASKLNLNRSVRLMRGEVQVPLVTGIWRPTIILPSQRVFERSTFDQVVLHELSHVKRRDLLWVWLPEILRMLLFFHPIAYWIQQQAKLNSEMACDELVLSAGPNRRAYANTLLELASPAPLTSS